MKGSTAERFWAKVNKTADCWEWVGAKSSGGYGAFGYKGRVTGAHRVAWDLARGAIPEGMIVDHTCHNRSCVNPAHLRLATNKQNLENRAGAQANSKTGIRGVSWSPDKGKWAGYVVHHGKHHKAGFFDRIEDAEAAVIALRLELFTHNVLDREQQDDAA